MASAVALACAGNAISMPSLQPSLQPNPQIDEFGIQEQRQSLTWLNETPKGNQTIQVATVLGRENCLNLLKDLAHENQVEARCFESTENNNRFFVLVGSYSTIDEAKSCLLYTSPSPRDA